MSAIDPDLLNLAPSPQDLLDEAVVDDSPGERSGLGGAGGAGATQEPPQEQALDALNQFTEAAQTHVQKEMEEHVPTELLQAQEMTSTLVGGITATATEALAAAAERLSPESVLGLLQG